MTPPSKLHRVNGMGKWWIAVALGRRYYALWSDGSTDSWATRDVHKGWVIGLNAGRVDGT